MPASTAAGLTWFFKAESGQYGRFPLVNGDANDLGTLEKEKLADLIIVTGDPLTNIDDVAKVQCVMKNGRLMSVSEVAKSYVQISTGADICDAY